MGLPDPHRDLRAAVSRAIREGEGVTERAARQRAHDDGTADGEALGAYVATVRDNAYKVTDAQVAALHAAGLDDDAVFELTVATAVGQATRQLDAALAALTAALEDRS